VGRFAAQHPAHHRLSDQSRSSAVEPEGMVGGCGAPARAADSERRRVDTSGEGRFAPAGASRDARSRCDLRRSERARSADDDLRTAAGRDVRDGAAVDPQQSPRRIGGWQVGEVPADSSARCGVQHDGRPASHRAPCARRYRAGEADACRRFAARGADRLSLREGQRCGQGNALRDRGGRHRLTHARARRGDGVLSLRAGADGSRRCRRVEEGGGPREARRCVLPQRRLSRGHAVVSVSPQERAVAPSRFRSERRRRARDEEDRQSSDETRRAGRGAVVFPERAGDLREARRSARSGRAPQSHVVALQGQGRSQRRARLRGEGAGHPPSDGGADHRLRLRAQHARRHRVRAGRLAEVARQADGSGGDRHEDRLRSTQESRVDEPRQHPLETRRLGHGSAFLQAEPGALRSRRRSVGSRDGVQQRRRRGVQPRQFPRRGCVLRKERPHRREDRPARVRGAGPRESRRGARSRRTLERSTHALHPLHQARRLRRVARVAAERARDKDLIAEASYTLANIEDERENMLESQKHLARAMSIFEQNHTVQGLARAHTASASILFRQQKIEEAAKHAELGRKYALELGDRFNLAKNDWMWGKLLYFQGDREGAAQKFESARLTFEDLDTPYELGRLLFDVGLLQNEPDEATVTIRSAIRIFERLEASHDLERARGALFRIKPAGKAPDQTVVGLYEVVKIINSTLNLEEVLNRVLDVVIRRLRAERGMILLLDPITSALRTRVVRNIKEDAGDSKRSPQSIVKEVIQSGQSVMSADARADARFVESESVIAENILSILCVPLIIKDRIAGAIYVDHRQARHLFSQKDLSFLEAFSDQAAIAIENARLYEELEEARTRLSLENETLRREVLVEKHLDSVVGQSEAVAKIQFSIRKASSGNSTVLVRGESGTGKGLIARIIHNVSPRRNGPFIKFNCAALPETLAESELFGHEKGAFTGADRRKLGRFELANN